MPHEAPVASIKPASSPPILHVQTSHDDYRRLRRLVPDRYYNLSDAIRTFVRAGLAAEDRRDG